MSGAKNCPETPRQRMIGMMYLVLTAMLALNVSADILNGFSMVDDSLHTTITSTEKRNVALFSDFKSLYHNNPAKVKEWLDKALVVQKKSDDLFNYIENFKKMMVKMTDGADRKDSTYVRQINGKDNTNVTGEYGINAGNGKILKQKIEDYKNFLIKLSDGNPEKQKIYQMIFATKGGPEGSSWEMATFESMPVAAVITILSKYQSDVRAAEAEIVQYLKAQTDVNDFRVNKIQALVIPDSRYVIKGDTYKAQIVLSAIDSTSKPSYFVNGSQLGANGMYQTSCLTVGAKTYSGRISIQGNDGIMRSYPFKSDYMVGEPTATLSNEDLNVVYKGIDNKFSISVPGVSASDINISVDGGNYTKVTPGRFIIHALRDGEIRINVFAMIDKKNLSMGGNNYRVKNLPDPKAFLQEPGGKQFKSGGFMTPDALKNSTVIASYGVDELVKANFTVRSFTMLAKGLSPQTVTGMRLSPQFINKLQKGDIMVINDIRAIGPDGLVRNLSPITVQL